MPLKLFRLAMLGALVSAGCVDIVGADFAKYVEREEKHFATTGKPDVTLGTFDGSIEIRPWDRSEVQVVIEKRAGTKEAAETIQVQAEQNGDQIVVDVSVPKTTGFHFHFN